MPWKFSNPFHTFIDTSLPSWCDSCRKLPFPSLTHVFWLAININVRIMWIDRSFLMGAWIKELSKCSPSFWLHPYAVSLPWRVPSASFFMDHINPKILVPFRTWLFLRGLYTLCFIIYFCLLLTLFFPVLPFVPFVAFFFFITCSSKGWLNPPPSSAPARPTSQFWFLLGLILLTKYDMLFWLH